MKKIKNIFLSLVVLVTVIIVSGYAKNTSILPKNEAVPVLEKKQNQTVNLFVTHGHCSTPFSGVVNNLKVDIPVGENSKNSLKAMKISFEIDPNSFDVNFGNDLTKRVKTPGIFIGKKEEKIAFRSTNIYTMGIDWYQVNGIMSIKGVEKNVKLFVTGIKDSKDAMASSLVLAGQVNLFDWGIDYDKIVSGNSGLVPTKWLYINMKIEMLC